MRFTRITIIRESYPQEQDVNDDLQWFGTSLGLFGERDKDRSCFRIFIVLLKALKAKKGLSSDEIAAQTRLTRGTVIHHLNRLMEAGIVGSERSKYFLMVENLEELVSVVQKNVEKTLSELQGVAKGIDKRLGL